LFESVPESAKARGESAEDQEAMGEVINLNQYRKQREKAEKTQRSAGNRLRHGRTREERINARQKSDSQTREFDGKQLEPGPPDDPPEVG
jgi:hypothetical protein